MGARGRPAAVPPDVRPALAPPRHAGPHARGLLHPPARRLANPPAAAPFTRHCFQLQGFVHSAYGVPRGAVHPAPAGDGAEGWTGWDHGI